MWPNKTQSVDRWNIDTVQLLTSSFFILTFRNRLLKGAVHFCNTLTPHSCVAESRASQTITKKTYPLGQIAVVTCWEYFFPKRQSKRHPNCLHASSIFLGKTGTTFLALTSEHFQPVWGEAADNYLWNTTNISLFFPVDKLKSEHLWHCIRAIQPKRMLLSLQNTW